MLIVHDLSVQYGSKVVLSEVNLHLEKGETATIVGHNGAGKSTFFGALSGKVPVTSGQIHLDHQQIQNQNEIQRASLISCLFQNPFLGCVPTMSVQENLALAMYKGRKAFLKAGLDSFPSSIIEEVLVPLNLGLENHLDTPMGSLSGGQRQIIAFVMATLVAPQLLLLDEPTAALDPSSALKLMNLAHSYIKKHQISAILISHDLKQALSFGDKIWILSKGTICKEITAEEKQQMTPDLLLKLMQGD